MKQQCLKNERHLAFDHRSDDDLSIADQLFLMLDGHEVAGREGSWRAEVVGIHACDDATWVQIGPSQGSRWQTPGRALTMRLAEEAGLDSAVRALHEWSGLPESARPDRIDVTAR